MQICTMCLIDKADTEYDAATAGGLKKKCKPCRLVYKALPKREKRVIKFRTQTGTLTSCKMCKTDKTANEFGLRSDGVTQKRRCRTCNRAYRRLSTEDKLVVVANYTPAPV